MSSLALVACNEESEKAPTGEIVEENNVSNNKDKETPSTDDAVKDNNVTDKNDTEKPSTDDAVKDNPVSNKNDEEKPSTNETVKENKKADAEKAIKQAVLDNALAIEKEDVQAYLNGYILADDLKADTKTAIENQFKNLDLKYSINKIEILELKDNLATVQVEQTTKNTAGGDGYKDNQSISKYTMKLVNGKWKIATYETEIVKFLDEVK